MRIALHNLNSWCLPAGVHIPTEAAVYEPILEMLAGEGLGFQEESTYSAA